MGQDVRRKLTSKDDLIELCQDSTSGSDRLGIFGAVGSSQYQAFFMSLNQASDFRYCMSRNDARHLLLQLRPHRVPGLGRAARLGRLLARR